MTPVKEIRLAAEPIEIVLLRQWASYIADPVWITDPSGRLLFYNESLEPIIGISFEEADDMPAGDLANRFQICELDGTPIAEHDRPLMIALAKQMPAHRRIALHNPDGSLPLFDVTAIPILSSGDRQLGAMATIWDPVLEPAPLTIPDPANGQLPIEVILTRHWASYLAVPIWVTDPAGSLLYLNQPAAALTGVIGDPEDGVPVAAHPDLFKICDLDGSPLSEGDLPISVALSRRVAAHRPMKILSLDGHWRTIEVTALPLVGQNQRFLGGVALFWETGP